MPTLNIGGQRVKVGDEFLGMSPEEQNSAVEEISKSLGGAAKQPEPPSTARSAAIGFGQGLTGGWQDEMAGLAVGCLDERREHTTSRDG